MRNEKGQFIKGHKQWLGKHRSEKDKKIMSDAHKGQIGNWLGKKRQNISGKNHPRWKGGVTPENDKARKSDSYKVWRKACMERDNFTDQKTGISGGYLVVHHINNFSDFPELRLALDNGITLSVESHKEFHKKYGRQFNTKEQIKEFLNNG
jgi:5-methylcytosine-specific restriction endonuclease McrA